MMRKPNEFDTLGVLHYLWKKGQMDTVQVKDCLWEGHGLLLTVLSNGYIKAETPDGTTKYANKL
jgi:hypothetical protein